MNIDKIKQILFVIWPLSVGRNNPAFIGLLLIQTLRVCRVSVSEVKYNLIGFIKHFSRFLLCKQINDSQKYRMFIDSSERRQKSEIRQGTPFDWLMKVKFSLSQKTVSNSFTFQELGISRFK